tara:strand:+ start:162 stop:542 length:381 start_codon:yes stop_codon:yes gene_type:complete
MIKKVIAGSICFILGLAVFAFAQTQQEMNQEVKSDYEIADAQLNKVYKELRIRLSDTEKAGLKEAQLAWLNYRDKNAEFAMSLYEGGSIAPMVYSAAMASVTEARVDELKSMFREGYPEEGDGTLP